MADLEQDQDPGTEAEAEVEAQVFDFSTLSEGQIDPTLGKRIDTLIERDTGYIVYLDDQLFALWSTASDYEPEEGWDAFYQLSGRITHVEAKGHEVFRKKEQRYYFMRLLGDVYAALVGPGKAEYAEGALERAESYLASRQQELSRLWQLTGAIQTSATFLVVALVLWMARARAIEGMGQSFVDGVLLAAAGATGALFSIISRLGNENLDPSGNEPLQRLEGRARIVVGAIAAVFVTSAWKGGFLPALEADPSFFALLAMALGSGISERIPKNLVRTLEGGEDVPEDEEDPPDDEEPEEGDPEDEVLDEDDPDVDPEAKREKPTDAAS